MNELVNEMIGMIMVTNSMMVMFDGDDDDDDEDDCGDYCANG